VRNAAGASLITDTNDGPEECGRISPGLNTTARALAAGTYYVDVTAAAGRTATYTLTVEVLAPTVCANYLLDTGEQCDDGNAASGDGCSASCQLERTEAEANNAFSTANLLRAGAPSTIGASIGTADEDWFRVVVGAGQSLTIVTHGGGIDECGSDSDTVVDLLGPDGSTVLATDDDDGPGVCSTIDRAQAAGLAAGTYYIRVRPYWSNRTFPYVLSIRVE